MRPRIQARRDARIWVAGFLAIGLPRATVAAEAGDPVATDMPRHRFQVGARVGFRVQVDLRNTGGSVSAAAAGPATGGAVPRTYADGYVGVDDSGNAGGETWHWGYQRDEQRTAGDAALQFTAWEGNPYGETTTHAADPGWGTELGYRGNLGRVAAGWWGLDLGLDWASLTVSETARSRGDLTRLTDTYPLRGITPPAAPYVGTAEGPGPLLPDVPDRSLTTRPTQVTLASALEADLITLKAGPALEMPLGLGRAHARISAGVVVAHFQGTVTYSDLASTLIPGGTWNRSGKLAGSEWLTGGYARAECGYLLTDRVGIYAGAEFQALGSPVLRDGAREAAVRLSGGLACALGFSFAF